MLKACTDRYKVQLDVRSYFPTILETMTKHLEKVLPTVTCYAFTLKQNTSKVMFITHKGEPEENIYIAIMAR